jgi:dephospho-CoA kinase
MPTLVLGLTGSIGSGKSAVLSHFDQLGFPTCSADALAREVVRPGTPALADIVATFGDEVLAPDASLDRSRLAAIVFSDEDARAKLEAIIHPKVREAELEFIARHADATLVVIDVPLLFESGFDAMCDRTVTVVVDEATRRERLARRADQLSPEQIERRLRTQMPQNDKARRSDAVIDNAGSLAATRRQVEDLLVRWGVPIPAPQRADSPPRHEGDA